MDKSRREFLSTAAWMGAAVAVGGCVSAGNKLNAGCAAMSNFKVAPMKRIRVAMVAVGARGYWALERLVTIPGLEITAICDLVQEKIDKSNKLLREKGRLAAKVYCGPEAYKRLVDDGVADVFYNCTPRDIHTELNVYAMNGGMHVLTEVPAGTSRTWSRSTATTIRPTGSGPCATASTSTAATHSTFSSRCARRVPASRAWRHQS